jgi:hypothetical protein
MGQIFKHSNYRAILVQDVQFEPTPFPSPERWWEFPVGSKGGTPVFRVPTTTGNSYAVMLEPEVNPERVLSLLALHRRDFPGQIVYGGLAFLDQDTGQVLLTNWDIAESEEWTIALDALMHQGHVRHTFSATDNAMELHVRGKTVEVQMLDWEAFPNGIESSRVNEPVHVFEDVERFARQVKALLEFWTSLKSHAVARGSSREDLELLFLSARRESD